MRRVPSRFLVILLLGLLLAALCGCAAWERAWQNPLVGEAMHFGAFWGTIPGVLVLGVLAPLGVGVPVDVIPEDNPDFVEAAMWPSYASSRAGAAIVGFPFALLVLPYEILRPAEPPVPEVAGKAGCEKTAQASPKPAATDPATEPGATEPEATKPEDPVAAGATEEEPR